MQGKLMALRLWPRWQQGILGGMADGAPSRQAALIDLRGPFFSYLRVLCTEQDNNHSNCLTNERTNRRTTGKRTRTRAADRPEHQIRKRVRRPRA